MCLFLRLIISLKRASATNKKRLLREKIAEHTRMEQGCIKYEYYLPIDRADELFLLEAWESREDQQIHLQSDHMRKMREFKSEYVESTELGQM